MAHSLTIVQVAMITIWRVTRLKPYKLREVNKNGLVY